jgi:hypothetical protein
MIMRLHAADIEIVSPAFINQRQVNDKVFMPKRVSSNKKGTDHGDEINFASVVVATELEKAQQRLELLTKRMESLKSSNKDLEKTEPNERRSNLGAFKARITLRMKDEKKKLEAL